MSGHFVYGGSWLFRTRLALVRAFAQQRWIRYGVRDRLARFFCPIDRVGPIEFETDFFGLRYRGFLNSYIDWSVYFYGAYEWQDLQLLRNLMRDPGVFIDVGANVGNHSIFMTTCSTHVHSFEPNPVVRKHLQDKVSQNHLQNITIHAVGVGNENKELPFFLPQGVNQGTGSFVPSHSQSNIEGPVLSIVDGDEYLAKIDDIRLVKIDVEGFEKNVLLGLGKTFARCRPFVTVEFSDTTKASFSSAEELLSLFPADYRVVAIGSQVPVLFFFAHRAVRLTPFDFTPGDLLFYPAERSAQVPI